MLRKIIATTAVALGLSAGAASAATVYANEVTGFKMDGSSTTCSLGTGTADSSRSNLCNALGAPDHPGGNSEFGFLSAGAYDALKFTFGGAFTGPVNFFEITFNRDRNWVEALDLVFLLTGESGATFAQAQLLLPDGTITNNTGAPDPSNGSRWILTYDPGVGPFSELWVFDASSGREAAGGGFDIDAISANLAPSVVPLPAAGFLLLAGLGGLAMAGRRRRG